MNKKEVAEAIYNKLDVKKFEAYTFIDLLMETMTETLQAGDKLVIVNFGTFKVMNRMQKRVIDPNSKKAMTIPARKIVKFFPSQNLKNLVRT